MLTYLYEYGLQQFAEGAGDGANASAAAAEGANAADVVGSEAWLDREIRRHFGVSASGFAAPEQTADAGTEQTAAGEAEAPAKTQLEPEAAEGDAAPEKEEAEDIDAAFEADIKGKYKDQFGRRVQGIINERFKTAKAAEQQSKELLAALDPYLAKLGWKPGDPIQALKDAAVADRSNFVKLASEKGVTIEQAAQDYQTARAASEAEEAEKEAEEAQAEAQRQAENEKTFARWEQDAAELGKTVPGFDLRNEIRTNERFAKMLDAGIDVITAYRGTHFDELLAGVAGAVAKQTAQNTAQSIAAGRARPAEGGIRQSAPVQTERNYATMSDAEIMRIFNAHL